jgi:hypothetical protein
MSTIFEPQKCAQCRHDSADLRHDRRTGDYEINCGRCGHHESHHSDYDEDASYAGFTHTDRRGAGVLWFRYSGERPIYCHYLHTLTEVLAAERWLREGLDNGTVEVGTAFLTRWDDETQRAEAVVGELLSFLAGKIVRISGVPGDVEQDNRGNCLEPQTDQTTL